jgi:hypothetical protein
VCCPSASTAWAVDAAQRSAAYRLLALELLGGMKEFEVRVVEDL